MVVEGIPEVVCCCWLPAIFAKNSSIRFTRCSSSFSEGFKLDAFPHIQLLFLFANRIIDALAYFALPPLPPHDGPLFFWSSRNWQVMPAIRQVVQGCKVSALQRVRFLRHKSQLRFARVRFGRGMSITLDWVGCPGMGSIVGRFDRAGISLLLILRHVKLGKKGKIETSTAAVQIREKAWDRILRRQTASSKITFPNCILIKSFSCFSMQCAKPVKGLRKGL